MSAIEEIYSIYELRKLLNGLCGVGISDDQLIDAIESVFKETKIEPGSGTDA